MNSLEWKELGITSYNDITATQMQDIYQRIRLDGLNLRQTQAAIRTITCEDTCSQLSFFDVLHEMDRRYYLRRDLVWEFTLLDNWKMGLIEISEAQFLMKAVHKDYFNDRQWKKFLTNRPVPEAMIAFEEIEVDLCNIPSLEQLEQDIEEEIQENLEKESVLELELKQIESDENAEREKNQPSNGTKEAVNDKKSNSESENMVRELESIIKEEELKRKEAQEAQEVARIAEAKKKAEEEADRIVEEQRKEREEAERIAEEQRKEREEAERIAEEQRKEREEAERIAEEQQKEREEIERIAEKQKKEREEAERIAEEQRKQEEAEEQRKQEEAASIADEKRKAEEEAAQKQLEEEMYNAEEQQKNESLNSMETLDTEEMNKLAEIAANAEADAKREAEIAAEAALKADSEDAKKAALEAERIALEKARKIAEERLTSQLKSAMKSNDIDRLRTTLKEFKKAKIENSSELIQKAESTLKMWLLRNELNLAVHERQIPKLETAIEKYKKSTFTADLQTEYNQANDLLGRLKRLDKMRHEILSLKQSTVAEIRSYQKPHVDIHNIMIATYILLGYKEKRLQDWKNLQALIGKTGKEGLKRQTTTIDPVTISEQNADRGYQLLKPLDIEKVRDLSSGAATFYVWSMNMIEEVNSIHSAGK